jgi:hypothetical protein
MSRFLRALYLLSVFLLVAAPALPARVDPRDQSIRLTDGREGGLLVGRPQGFTPARDDSICLLGANASPNLGDFEEVGGRPSWDGWFGVDRTAPTSSHWHVDTYHAANLDPFSTPNHAWWCGEMWPSCGPGDPAGGYGNYYIEYLDWYGDVPAPGSPTTMRIAAVLNHDMELGYDYLYLEYEDANGMGILETFNGRADSVVVDASHVFAPADFVTNPSTGNPAVHLRFRFQSDGGWSDEDCSYPSAGAAQVDLITVFFDQGAGESPAGPTETCEPGSELQWEEVLVGPGVGNYAKIWWNLQDLDPCRSNPSPQVAFIDDGEVVPCSGPYFCTTWCYGPNGYTVNPEGGCAGPEFHLWNEIWSPVLAWPEGDYSGAFLDFDVWDHVQLYSAGMTWSFHVRSTADPLGLDGWTPWVNRGLDYYEPAGEYRYRRASQKGINPEMTSLLVPDRQHVQIALGIHEVGYQYGWDGLDATPGPYFDNVTFKAFRHQGPYVAAEDNDLAADNFPEIGTIDPANPGANHVRFDAYTFWAGTSPRDDIRVIAAAVRAGAALSELPRLHYRLRPNPLFDAYRTSGLPLTGSVAGDSARSVSGLVIADTWSFDLPDSGFFFPGDVIHYYIAAKDIVGSDERTTLLPGDTTGFSLFRGDPGYQLGLYDSEFVVNALPTLSSLAPLVQPPILLHFDGLGGQAEWFSALANLGFQEGVDYDMYWRSGLGFRATHTLFLGYTSYILHHGGSASLDEALLLDAWLEDGGRNMLLCADGIVSALYYQGLGFFLSKWLPAYPVTDDVAPLIDGQTRPRVHALAGNPVFYTTADWLADGGCPDRETFEGVLAEGTSQRIAEWLGPDGEPAGYPYAAGLYNHNLTFDAQVVYLPYDFYRILTPSAASGRDDLPVAARAHVLEEILRTFGHLPSGQPTDIPERQAFSVRAHPNPFNPGTVFSYHMSQQGRLTIKIFNARGERVRTLVDEVIQEGDGTRVWDGRDDAGRAVASGVYVYRVQAPGDEEVGKLALVK